ncbi:BrnA antitoxin family protein [Bradyrhizobium sp.]|uniref:BrnA antitoxin family protein n=1 Tax=Bradyrhizobium sp. TaxID=376 RepID=UPI00239EC365|nr:BrnA antitoxin family protein [Bradyrhizobium sp.]MDE2376992.1 BrnA antitoxin family protein [Bradyrhizobium sp.]
MSVRKRSIKSDLVRVDAHRVTRAEYEEAPELTKDMLDRAEIRHGNRIVKRGRPPIEHPKEAVKLRLDHDVLAAYRKTGRGWQTRINADLRKAAKRLAG